MDANTSERHMDSYQTDALGLQKRLLNLRREHASLVAAGHQEQAHSLASTIARIEQMLASLPPQLKPIALH